ncbi:MULTISPECIES: hypothetical protein [Acidithiobacillus]|uniref:hypothetical protein n=1 Tax=Acidithiobacillus ferrivorans TaxID=160808 RepID=UPI001C0659FC|nr:hypothetical protein [Acidithiobacillus ferrivorans]MBU2851658.1 hypothetical protein [Acidithiobacillus ferrivorans]
MSDEDDLAYDMAAPSFDGQDMDLVLHMMELADEGLAEDFDAAPESEPDAVLERERTLALEKATASSQTTQSIKPPSPKG